MKNIDIAGIDRVLIIKLRHIGDVLLSVPAISALKDARPEISITALVPSGTEDMLTLNPDIDEVIPLDRKTGLAGNVRLIARLRKKKFDLAINMTEGDRGAIITRLCGARHRVGVDPRGRGFSGKRFLFTHLVRPVYDGRQRAVIDMDLLGPLGLSGVPPRLALYTSAEDDEYVATVLAGHGITEKDSVAVVHPASRWLFKCWRDEAVARVIDYLGARGMKVVLTSGPDRKESDMVARIIGHSRTNPVDLSGRLSLKRLASLLKRSSLFFGVDTAPMHMAAAVGIPVVALFGPSDNRTWAPLTDRRRVITKDAEFPCIPCKKDGCDGTKKSRCLEAITPEEAIAAIEELIGAADAG